MATDTGRSGHEAEANAPSYASSPPRSRTRRKGAAPGASTCRSLPVPAMRTRPCFVVTSQRSRARSARRARGSAARSSRTALSTAPSAVIAASAIAPPSRPLAASSTSGSFSLPSGTTSTRFVRRHALVAIGRGTARQARATPSSAVPSAERSRATGAWSAGGSCFSFGARQPRRTSTRARSTSPDAGSLRSKSGKRGFTPNSYNSAAASPAEPSATSRVLPANVPSASGCARTAARCGSVKAIEGVGRA